MKTRGRMNEVTDGEGGREGHWVSPTHQSLYVPSIELWYPNSHHHAEVPPGARYSSQPSDGSPQGTHPRHTDVMAMVACLGLQHG